MHRLLLPALVLILAACDDKEDTAPPVQDLDEDGWAAEDDCNDHDASINPGAEETPYNGVDDDCDPTTLDDDLDGDGYLSEEDCDDLEDAIHPGAEEACDGIDNDCDGDIDEDTTETVTWFPDGDGDGYGVPGETVEACLPPSGYADNPDDCNDKDANTHPDADEICDGADNDCDDDIDEDAVDATIWWSDMDGDGFGMAGTDVQACDQPKGMVSSENGEDCNDGDAGVHPGANEVCDDIDNDCDEAIDGPGAEGAQVWFADRDGDGYGDPLSTTRACDQPSDYVSDNTDCDDRDDSTHPGADEYCDKRDTDCDGTLDEDDALDAPVWYVDADGDGHGDPATAVQSCTQPSGTVTDGSDCDDGDNTVNPAALEICDAIDNDCDGDVDEDDAVDASSWYIDADGDGFGSDSATTQACTLPSGYDDDALDCDDLDSAVYPGATEIWYDGTDQDCAGDDDYDADADGDQSDAYGGNDCDDADATIHSGAKETWYDGIDQDCDGHSDYDQDYDGYDSAPWGGTDCDDTDATRYPGADEIDSKVDNDCDGDVETMPVVVATWDTSSSTLEHCTMLLLDGSGSYDPDGPALVSHQWTVVSVPTGSAVDDSSLDDPTSETPVLYPDVAGDYEFLLTVTDTGDITESASLAVTITARSWNTTPVADAGSDQTLSDSVSCTSSGYSYICDDCADTVIILDGTGSQDDESEPLSYAWRVDSGDAVITTGEEELVGPTATLTGPPCSHGTSNTDTYVFELEVTDCFGDVTTDTVTVSYTCTGE